MRQRPRCILEARLTGNRLYTAWTRNEAGERVKLWRIGKTKYFPAFRWVPTIKFLGIKASYGPFEMQTLTFRISEAKQKLRQVRKFVYNRRVASTMSRLRVWQSVVWPTLAFGLAEVGLSLESSKSLKAWYAFKIRSVLNKPAHVTHMTTAELYELYSIEDPVVKLERLQSNRLSSLNTQQVLSPSITSTSEAIQQSQDQLTNLRQFKHLPETEAAEGMPIFSCQDCDRSNTPKLWTGTFQRGLTGQSTQLTASQPVVPVARSSSSGRDCFLISCPALALVFRSCETWTLPRNRSLCPPLWKVLRVL